MNTGVSLDMCRAVCLEIIQDSNTSFNINPLWMVSQVDEDGANKRKMVKHNDLNEKDMSSETTTIDLWGIDISVPEHELKEETKGRLMWLQLINNNKMMNQNKMVDNKKDLECSSSISGSFLQWHDIVKGAPVSDVLCSRLRQDPLGFVLPSRIQDVISHNTINNKNKSEASSRGTTPSNDGDGDVQLDKGIKRSHEPTSAQDGSRSEPSKQMRVGGKTVLKRKQNQAFNNDPYNPQSDHNSLLDMPLGPELISSQDLRDGVETSDISTKIEHSIRKNIESTGRICAISLSEG